MIIESQSAFSETGLNLWFCMKIIVCCHCVRRDGNKRSRYMTCTNNVASTFCHKAIQTSNQPTQTSESKLASLKPRISIPSEMFPMKCKYDMKL